MQRGRKSGWEKRKACLVFLPVCVLAFGWIFNTVSFCLHHKSVCILYSIPYFREGLWLFIGFCFSLQCDWMLSLQLLIWLMLFILAAHRIINRLCYVLKDISFYIKQRQEAKRKLGAVNDIFACHMLSWLVLDNQKCFTSDSWFWLVGISKRDSESVIGSAERAETEIDLWRYSEIWEHIEYKESYNRLSANIIRLDLIRFNFIVIVHSTSIETTKCS